MYSFFPETPKEAVRITQVSYMLHLFLTMKKSFYLYLLVVNEVFAYLPYPGLPNFRLLWPVILLSRKETIIPYMMVICIIVWYYKHWFTTNTDFQTQDSLLRNTLTHSVSESQLSRMQLSLSLFTWGGISIQFLPVGHYSFNIWLSSTHDWFYWKSVYEKKHQKIPKKPKIQYGPTKTSIFSLHNSMTLLNHGTTHSLIFFLP